jgi:unsaturated rhamnogalacturonyl hydrolase
MTRMRVAKEGHDMGCSPILDKYIDQLMEKSTPEVPAWNLEKIRSGKPNTWNYIDGCMVKALLTLGDITGDERYTEFADAFIDFFVHDDGSILYYDPKEYNLDNVNAGKTLYRLYEITGKEKYRRAMDTIYFQLQGQPRTKEGNFWHKLIYPNQIWLDGLYMAQPFYMQYEIAFRGGCEGEEGSCSCYDSYRQFLNVRELMRDDRNGLYYHAYDSSREDFWCDPVTGLSNNFWLRAEGWFAMALCDTWEIMPEAMSQERDGLAKMFVELIDAVLPYQDEKSGMWYDVINLGRIAPNYLETSGSAIFSYAILKGVRLGILDESYYYFGRKAFDGICDHSLSVSDEGELQLDHICLVSGLGNIDHREGTFEYYMREPVVKNDAKGVAPLVLAYTEILMREKKA